MTPALTPTLPRGRALRVLAVGLLLAALGLPVSAGASPAPYAKRITGYLTAPDGVQLKYSVLLPKASGRFPVAMVYNGYDAGSIGGSSWMSGSTWMSSELETSVVQHGYALVGLQMRGTGCSSGSFDLFSKQWGTDGALGVEWAARQRWSTGRVGMFEWSWPGIAQLFTAAERPRGLAAVAPGMVVTDPLRDVGAPGGVPDLTFPGLWWGTIQDAWTYAGRSAVAEGDARCVSNLARNVVAGQVTSPVTAYQHPYEDAFWQQRDLLAATKRINVPVLSLTDWQDEEVGARGGYYQRGLDPSKTWFVGTNGQHDVYLSKTFRRTLFAFLDRFVKGRNNGFDATPHVQLWQDTRAAGGPQSSDAELTDAAPTSIVTQGTLPLTVTPNRLYFTAAGTLTTTRPRSASGERALVAVRGPAVNVDAPAAVAGSNGGPLGEAPWQASRLDAGSLAYTSAPLATSVVVAGTGSLDLWVSSALPAGALQATVTDVRPDGQEVYLQRGWLDLTQRALDRRASTPVLPVHPQTLAAVSPMVPGQLTLVRMEIPQFSHVFHRGSAIRVVIDAPSATGDWDFGALPAQVMTVANDAAHPSSLVLGVMRTGLATGPLVTCDSMPGTPCRSNSLAVPREDSLALRARTAR